LPKKQSARELHYINYVMQEGRFGLPKATKAVAPRATGIDRYPTPAAFLRLAKAQPSVGHRFAILKKKNQIILLKSAFLKK